MLSDDIAASSRRARGGARRGRAIRRLALCAGLCSLLLVAGTPAGAAETGKADRDPQFNALFHESMRRPADVNLAFRLARRAVELGDYEAAIGVYERMLFYEPGLVRVKLELARIYYRLGANEAARTYFVQIKESPVLTPAERENVAAYLGEIERRLSTNQWSVYAQAGVRYQSNASYGPTGSFVIGQNVGALLPPTYRAQGDGNVFALSTIRHVYDFGNQRGDVWESALSLYYSQQFQISRLDLGYAEFRTGPRLALEPDALPGWSVHAYGIVGGIALGGAGYLGSYGAGVSVHAPFNFGFNLEPFLEVRQRNYSDTFDYPTAGLQSGAMWSAGASAFGQVTQTVSWRLRMAYSNADGEVPWYAYDNFAVDLALPVEFEGLWGARRWVAIPTFGYALYNYDQPNPFITSAIDRTDNEYRVGLALDVPVKEGVGVLAQVLYTWSQSSLPNYSFNNLSLSIGPNLRF